MHLVAIAGDLFDKREEQEKLLQVLLSTELEHARPTAAIQKQLKDAWGWTERIHSSTSTSKLCIEGLEPLPLEE